MRIPTKKLLSQNRIVFFNSFRLFDEKKKTDIQLVEYQSLGEPLARLELATYALRMRCSTN